MAEEAVQVPCLNLEQLVEGVDDISDPSCMCKIQEYIDTVYEEDEAFMQLLVRNVQNDEVFWEQPWYQQTFKLTHQHNEPKTAENADTYRTDTITLQEHELIIKNWRKFRRRYNVPNKLTCLARWKNMDKSRNPKYCPEEKARRFVAAYLARGLQRNTYQIFQHIKSKYGGYNTGPFSSTEEKIIEICFEHKPHHMGSLLANVLGRQPRAIYIRLKQKVTGGKPEKKRLKWTLPIASKLVQNMLKYIGGSLEELKHKQIEPWVWVRLEQDMDQYHTYLHRFWHCSLHVQLFVKCDVKLSRLRKKVFRILRAKAQAKTYQIWSDIRWKDILSEFPDGFTHRFLYNVCNNLLKDYDRRSKAPLENIVDYAFETMALQPASIRNRRLKTLKLNEEGLLEVVKYVN